MTGKKPEQPSNATANSLVDGSLTAVMLKLASPTLETVAISVPVWPASTVPKSSGVGVTEITGAAGGGIGHCCAMVTILGSPTKLVERAGCEVETGTAGVIVSVRGKS